MVAYVDMVELISAEPLSVPRVMLRVVARMRAVYGGVLQPAFSEDFEAFLAQKDPVVTQTFFFLLLAEEEFLIDMVRTLMPSLSADDEHRGDPEVDKRERLELFIQFVRVKYRAVSRVHARVDNIEQLLRAYTQQCATAWTHNRVAYMQREIGAAEREHSASTESTADNERDMRAAAAAAAAAAATATAPGGDAAALRVSQS